MSLIDGPEPTVTTDAFLTDVTRVLNHGSANSTLKWALLMGLVDTAPLLAESGQIPLVVVADRVLRIYRRQAETFPALGSPLRQTAGGRHDLSVVTRLGGQVTDVSGEETLRMAWTLAQWPAPRLQIIGKEVVPLLFEVPGSWIEHLRSRGSHRAVPRDLFDRDAHGLPVLRPLPGGVDALMRVGPLLRQAIEFRWAVQVAEMNRIVIDPELALREFLFPSDERRGFSPQLRAALYEQQGGRCFWCEQELVAGDSDIDHVVPWSISRNDAVENLVLSDSTCNRVKSDLLPAPFLAARWIRYLTSSAAALADIADRFSLRTDPATSVAWLRGRYRLVGDDRSWTVFSVRQGHPGVVAGSALAEEVVRGDVGIKLPDSGVDPI